MEISMGFLGSLGYLFMVIFSLFSFLYATTDTDIKELLDTYSTKNALSQKTIDENKGHLVLFSREMLEKMHAKTLKDVFKTTPIVYYHENRYGLPDPLTSGAFESYNSNFIRLYIDGVEITQGWMGSGLLLYGDIGLDFVDHIEFYYMIPSFETSVEPAYLTIFLYSKDPQRDSGEELHIVEGSRGDNQQSISFAKQAREFSYMVNLSHIDAKREKINNGTKRPLSRDFERYQLFSYLKNSNQVAHLQVIDQKNDGLAGMSLDTTPLISKWRYSNLHIDYGIEFNQYWHAQASYDFLHTTIREMDEASLINIGLFGTKNDIDVIMKNSTYTGELTYKEAINKHHVVSGVKMRTKQLNSVVFKEDGAVPLSFDLETYATLFFQDQYHWDRNKIFTFGIEYNQIYRNDMMEDEDLLQLRLGYIFTTNNIVYKTYLYRLMYATNPLNRYLVARDENDILKPQTTIGLTQEFSYKDRENRVRLFLNLMQDKESLLQDVLSGKGADTKYFTTLFNYDYRFDLETKIDVQLYYAYYKHIFNLDRLEDMSGYISFMKNYGAIDCYHGIVWHRNSLDWKNYIDLTSSFTWTINEMFSVTLKGENLLNRAKKTNLFRADPASGTLLKPLKVSPIDRRIILDVEYRF